MGLVSLLLLALVALASARPGTGTTTIPPMVLPQYTCSTQAMAVIHPAMSSNLTLVAAPFTVRPMCRNAAGTFVAKSTNVTVTVVEMSGTTGCNIVAPTTFTQRAWLSCYTANTAKALVCGKFTCP